MVGRKRTILLLLISLFIAGYVSYQQMPKEAQPNVKIPIIYISITHSGISPEDAERLLIKPIEHELKSISGVKEMRSTAYEGYASVVLEFEAGFNSEKAISDVREKVDFAKTKLPTDSDDPSVHEVSFEQFPVLAVGLTGNIPERALQKIAKDLKYSIEGLPAVLEVTIAGERQDLLEIIVKPEIVETYKLRFDELFSFITQNNKLVAAGVLDTGNGRIPIKLKSVFETPEDLYRLPAKAVDDSVISIHDLATIHKTYQDPTGFARIAGKPAVILEIKKRSGKNVIDTITKVREIVEKHSKSWPDGLEVGFFQDTSGHIKNMITDLQNNLLSAIILVMIVMVVTMGLNSAVLVGIAIPGSFLSGLFLLNLMGLTINNMVLFSLILVVGMLVDGAIVVTEFADRKMAEGMHKKDAYILASQRMAHPIISSTLTTLAAFAPLLFWPGVVGEFMKYLPLTLIVTLTGSLFMALIFIPTLGSIFGKTSNVNDDTLKSLAASETGNLEDLGGFTGFYIRTLKKVLRFPSLVLLISTIFLIGSYVLYGLFGKGIEFFPDVEPDQAYFAMRMRGNYSVHEIDNLMKEVENKILGMHEFSTIYSNNGIDVSSNGGIEAPSDTVGFVNLEFKDWKERRKANIILDEAQTRLAQIPGIVIESVSSRAGPPGGKPINLQFSSMNSDLLVPAVEKAVKKFKSMEGLKDIDDTRPIPGYEWKINVDKEIAGIFGANVKLVGDMIQLITTGLKVDGYRPADSDDEVDIRIRYPDYYRSLNAIDDLRVPTAKAEMVPLSTFITQKATPKVSKIDRVNGMQTLSIRSDVKSGVLADDQVRELQKWLNSEAKFDPAIQVEFKGQDEEQKESQNFLMKAFLIALALIAIILVTEFDSFYDVFLILTAVIFSTIGVFLGLLITGQPFGIIMNGIGVIALAGIVVNNNIVLIDTYLRLKKTELNVLDAILRTCAQRLRPVMLTTITTVLGLIPMVCKLNLDFVNRTIDYGSPSTQWWAQLATSVAFGLAFATLLTLILTPSMLILGNNISRKLKRNK